MIKKITWFRKNQLDELQEQRLLKIEHSGFWLGFWGLVLVILVQLILTAPDEGFRGIAGELVILLCMAVYLLTGCIRNGIWDRHISAAPLVNIGISLFVAAVTALLFSLLSYKNNQNPAVAAFTFIIHFILVGAGSLAGLSLTSFLAKKRRQKLDAENADSE